MKVPRCRCHFRWTYIIEALNLALKISILTDRKKIFSARNLHNSRGTSLEHSRAILDIFEI